METVDALVVGAGVVGLAVARALALAGREVVVIEANGAIGEETSSRNSEVIHAGIYYPAGSLMAKTCVAGRNALYAYCDAAGVPYSRCGKLIVATNAEEEGRLARIREHAHGNGVANLTPITAAEAQALEPRLACTAALLSPSTGIIDSHAYMLALMGDAEREGAYFAFRTPFLAARAEGDGVVVETGGAEPMTLAARTLVNAAGLSATEVARAIDGLAADQVPTPYYAKGNYFTLAGRSPFSRLIYPVPVPGGLGTHLTIDLAGQARFGPDVEWVDRPNYELDPGRASQFYAAVRRYFPELPDGSLLPGYVGVRPKIAPPGQSQDFVIQGPRDHGVPGLVNLFGIESPGLTASLAIADVVLEAA